MGASLNELEPAAAALVVFATGPESLAECRRQRGIARLAGSSPDVCRAPSSPTSGSIVLGEDRVMAEIRRGAPWAEPATLVTGVINALERLGARKIVVATPYLNEIDSMEAAFLVGKGFDVLDIQGLNYKAMPC